MIHPNHLPNLLILHPQAAFYHPEDTKAKGYIKFVEFWGYILDGV